MQNNYVKELAIKTYQEEPKKMYVEAKYQTFHTLSFVGGMLLSVGLVGLF
ncbi:hypothetical protein MHO82_15450 [Vibrio sp. Of7-15]|nr:hypothetical protein [Vibrio sp. Of7-15]MCG7498263.1 hypothetical protein [Vibrio sp. Of7-15]